MPARTINVLSDPKDTAPHTIQVVLYTRVSTKDQEREGFSIPAQLRLLRDYAANNGFVIAQEFTDVETAKASGRTNFGCMLEYLKKHRAACRTILAEKTDRLYRNPKDWVTLDGFNVDIHFVKENEVASPNSRSSEKLMQGIRVLMAKQYIDNLSEEAKKGMQEKARSGFYPSFAPAGYLNVDGPGGKRVIVPDPSTALVVVELYNRFVAGRHSIRALVAELNAEGVTMHGRKLCSSLVHQILRKRLYTGDFDWGGATYEGSHEPLVTRECWQRAQALLDTRAKNKTRKVKHDFAFTGLVHCAHCNCLLVGDLKKGKYTYYRCSHNRGKCPEPYTREEVLTREFGNLLGELVIPKPILDWLDEAVLTSDRTELATRAQSIKKLQTRHDQLQVLIEKAYVDKLEERINEELFDKLSATRRQEQEGLRRKIQEIQNATPAPIEQAVNTLRLTSQASELFLQQSAEEQRRLLQVVVEQASWQNGVLQTKLFEPFEILRHSNLESHRKENENGGSGRDSKVWLLR